MDAQLTLRFGFPDDERALHRLAVLDSSEPLSGPVLMAEIEGEPWAAVSLSDGRVIADPFRPTVALIELLGTRARQLRGGSRDTNMSSPRVALRWRRHAQVRA